MKSIISNKYACVVCGDDRHLHKHHVFFGTANRKISEKYGCWVWLCPRHHNASNRGVHLNKVLDDKLKRDCQLEWEKIYGSRDEFIRVFGQSYVRD